MRPNQNNKRMRGRNNNNNNRKAPNPLSRTYESNGPDVKIRGTAHHIGEKYVQLARDAQSSGDPVMAESYLQHAEHYFRIIAAAQQAQFANFNRQAGESEAEDSEEDDDFNVGSDRFASPSERMPPQPQPFAGQPQQGQNGQQNYNNGGQPNYQERPQYEPRGDRGNRNFQDRNFQDRNYQDRNNQERGPYAERNGQNDRNGGRDGQGRDNRRPNPRFDNNGGNRYERSEPRGVSEDVAGASGLPAFITAPVPVRSQPEPDLPAEETSAETEVIARPEAEGEGETGYVMRPRRRRRKPEFSDTETGKAPVEE